MTKFYGDVRGVEDLSFTVEAGEMFGFLGPNGAVAPTAYLDPSAMVVDRQYDLLPSVVLIARQYDLVGVVVLLAATLGLGGLSSREVARRDL